MSSNYGSMPAVPRNSMPPGQGIVQHFDGAVQEQLSRQIKLLEELEVKLHPILRPSTPTIVDTISISIPPEDCELRHITNNVLVTLQGGNSTLTNLLDRLVL